MDTTCCYARQDKIWVRDPDGTPWEIFVTHADVEQEAGTPGSGSATAACCDPAAREAAAGNEAVPTA